MPLPAHGMPYQSISAGITVWFAALTAIHGPSYRALGPGLRHARRRGVS